MNKKELWLNIANYYFDDLVPTHLWDEIASLFNGPSPFLKAFADKLCRKLEWDKKFAFKAIWEYKKFVYMGVISDFSVTPSKIIDQVWHEHLLFSSGYRKFCKEIIQYDFDHNPELVSIDSQTEVFQSQYFQTVELYKKEFGIEPPADIWDVTKFKEKIDKPEKTLKNLKNFSYSDNYLATVSLVSMFSSVSDNDVAYGGGEFGGAGASGSWNDSSSDSSDGSAGDSSDSGSSDSGSSCSSSCGGGCGGGGGD